MLTEEMQNWTFDQYIPSNDTQLLFNVARDYADNFEQIKSSRGNGFGFIGPVGVGKTHLMASIANNLLTKSIGLIFVNTTSLIYELRQAEFRRDSLEDIDQKVHMLQNADLVLFDDLAKEKSTEWTRMQYYRIIDHRYIHSKPTGWTSNCGLDELGERLGDAATSRLIQMSGRRIVEVSANAEDYRLR
jgi:DNA replication protein DnaC